MSDEKKKITLKSFEKTLQAKEGDKKYIVRFESKEGEEITFPKNEKGVKSTNTITVKFREDKEKKESEIDVPNVEVTNDTGPIFRNIKLPKTINNIEMKDEVSLPVKGYEMGFWIGLIVSFIALVGFGYYWFSSSRKEDKEEEGL